ncbi:hypothetical protein [Actinacidiphila bryophytorum]|uniref:Uncharacterized protein n=1 Tax=Actinacidiphila bryophytorum TaxID=1436133 RepID=A0A9W4H483_9ACTN|nr:hypothetical protein [Actinacidiphila bryophytorum]MBM9435880.1 hypothetical protein [Actinacidiphila bryophytorum]MBN6544484.1 hypothetical protein [Actinacidiphila bryophytorum]CAG7649740.1 hypothetical protein SBRY_50181 [Actinacidiphila bryophytorum]
MSTCSVDAGASGTDTAGDHADDGAAAHGEGGQRAVDPRDRHHGNRYTAAGEGFRLTRDGWICELELPLDFDLLAREVAFPPVVKADPSHDGILDQGTWCLISGPGERAGSIVMPHRTD